MCNSKADGGMRCAGHMEPRLDAVRMRKEDALTKAFSEYRTALTQAEQSHSLIRGEKATKKYEAKKQEIADRYDRKIRVAEENFYRTPKGIEHLDEAGEHETARFYEVLRESERALNKFVHKPTKSNIYAMNANGLYGVLPVLKDPYKDMTPKEAAQHKRVNTLLEKFELEATLAEEKDRAAKALFEENLTQTLYNSLIVRRHETLQALNKALHEFRPKNFRNLVTLFSSLLSFNHELTVMDKERAKLKAGAPLHA